MLMFENGVSLFCFVMLTSRSINVAPCSTLFLFDRVQDSCSDIGDRYVLCQLLRILRYEIDP